MRHLVKQAVIAAIFVNATSAYSMTSMQATLWSVGGGCVGGAALGLYIDSRNHDPGKSTQGTIFASATGGCISGAIGALIFVEDDQSKAEKRADAAERKVDDIMRSVRNAEFRPTGKAQFLDHLKLEERFKGANALETLVNPACEKYKFTLSFDGRSSDDLYIPVSQDVIIKNIEYYLVAPAPNASPDTVCVKALEPFGYLNLELPGLESILWKHGQTAAKKLQGQ